MWIAAATAKTHSVHSTERWPLSFCTQRAGDPHRQGTSSVNRRRFVGPDEDPPAAKLQERAAGLRSLRSFTFVPDGPIGIYSDDVRHNGIRSSGLFPAAFGAHRQVDSRWLEDQLPTTALGGVPAADDGRSSLSLKGNIRFLQPRTAKAGNDVHPGRTMTMRMAIISTYPPRPCGIGTFSRDLRSALLEGDSALEVDVVSIIRDHHATAESEVLSVIRQDVRADYAAVPALLDGRLVNVASAR